MKKLVLISFLIGLGIIYAYPQDSIISIPDTAFLNALIDEGVDTDGDSLISYTEAETVISLDVYKRSISNMTGIEAFINLEQLNCSKNQLTSLDVSNNTALTDLSCVNNQLTTLDVSSFTALTNLYCSANQLTSLDVTNNAALTKLYCDVNQLTSLDVSGCTALKDLSCVNNLLTSLDFSNNTVLEWLFCDNNQLTNLDVSNNTALTLLICWNNQLPSLDVSGCTALKLLHCSVNQLTSLDVSNNTALTDLNCRENHLTSLDVSNNRELKSLSIDHMPSLFEVCVWIVPFPPPGFYLSSEGSSNIYYTTDCVYNNDSIVFIPDTAFLNALIDEGVDINGDSLISYAEAEYVTSLDVSDKGISELIGIRAFQYLDSLCCSRNLLSNLSVSGITALAYLDCSENRLTTLNVLNNTALTFLNFSHNRVSSLDVSANTALTELECTWNQLTSLDVFNNAALTYLDCRRNSLTSLDFSNNTSLTYLDCSEKNRLTTLNVLNNTALTYLNCDENELTTLDVSNNSALTYLNCFSNLLASLDVSKNTALKELYCGWNQLTSLDVSTNTALDSLFCEYNRLNTLEGLTNTTLLNLNCSTNQLTSLDVSNNTALTSLDCRGNQLTSLDVSKNIALEYLICEVNEITYLDVLNNSSLINLNCSTNQLTSLDVSNNTALTSLGCGWNQLTSLDVSNNSALTILNCEGNLLTSLDVSTNTGLTLLWLGYLPSLGKVCIWDSFFAEIKEFFTDRSPNLYFTTECGTNPVYIPDTAFQYALIDMGVDVNEDSLISYDEAELIRSLVISEKGIFDLTGIEAFVNLDTLDCHGNQLTNLEVSKNTELKYLDCRENQLLGLDISNNEDLIFIFISEMPILSGVCVWTIPFPPEDVQLDTMGSFNVYFTTECGANAVYIPDTAFLYALIEEGIDTNGDSLISFAEAEAAQTLYFYEKGIVDLTGIEAFIYLEQLYCENNQLTSLDVSKNIVLERLSCTFNHQLTNLDVSRNTALTILHCAGNQLTSLDVSNNTALTSLDCGWNQLTSLDISKNTALRTLYINGMPSLYEVCVWTIPFPPVGVYVYKEISHNVYYADCMAPDLIISNDSWYQPEFIEATNSEDGWIYLVPEGTEHNLLDIKHACIGDSIIVSAGVSVEIPIPDTLKNGIYWLYARDSTGNISEAVEFSIMGVGIEYNMAECIRIYPNPINTLLTIETSISDNYNIEITSLNGQFNHEDKMEGTTHQLDLSSFQKGIYFITIRSKDFVTTRKIIKL